MSELYVFVFAASDAPSCCLPKIRSKNLDRPALSARDADFKFISDEMTGKPVTTYLVSALENA